MPNYAQLDSFFGGGGGMGGFLGQIMPQLMSIIEQKVKQKFDDFVHGRDNPIGATIGAPVTNNPASTPVSQLSERAPFSPPGGGGGSQGGQLKGSSGGEFAPGSGPVLKSSGNVEANSPGGLLGAVQGQFGISNPSFANPTVGGVGNALATTAAATNPSFAAPTTGIVGSSQGQSTGTDQTGTGQGTSQGDQAKQKSDLESLLFGDSGGGILSTLGSTPAFMGG